MLRVTLKYFTIGYIPPHIGCHAYPWTQYLSYGQHPWT